MDGWQELVPPAYPEGDNVAVFCNKCGVKNRQDHGWRYRPRDISLPTHVVRAWQSTLHHLLGNNMYECNMCRLRSQGNQIVSQKPKK